MSVLDQSYRRWRGEATSYLRRILVIPRYDMQEILSRKAWLMSYTVTLLPPLGFLLMVYFAANMEVIRKFIPSLPAELTLPLPGRGLYASFAFIQIWLVTGFGLLVGPPLATRDFANNAMPLYLSKSIRRFEYVAGRSAAMLVLLSAASWLPLMIVFGVEMALAPPAWRDENSWIGGAILVSTVPSVVLLTAIVGAIAAHVHRTNLARAAILGLIFVTRPVGAMLERMTGSPLGNAVSPMAMLQRISSWAFEDPRLAEAAGRTHQLVEDNLVSPAAALAVIVLWFVAALWVLAWRVQPVEVVG